MITVTGQNLTLRSYVKLVMTWQQAMKKTLEDVKNHGLVSAKEGMTRGISQLTSATPVPSYEGIFGRCLHFNTRLHGELTGKTNLASCVSEFIHVMAERPNNPEALRYNLKWWPGHGLVFLTNAKQFRSDSHPVFTPLCVNGPIALDDIEYFLVPSYLLGTTYEAFSDFSGRFAVVDKGNWKRQLYKIMSSSPDTIYWGHAMRLPTPEDIIIKIGK